MGNLLVVFVVVTSMLRQIASARPLRLTDLKQSRLFRSQILLMMKCVVLVCILSLLKTWIELSSPAVVGWQTSQSGSRY